MPYKISGNVEQSTRVIIINEGDWTVESNTVESGDYSVPVASGPKTVLGRIDGGQSTGFGNITPEYYVLARGVIAGGLNGSSQRRNTMEYVTIATTGNVTYFGNLTAGKMEIGACSNGGNNRGVFAGGETSTSMLNNIDYITITATSHATDFGDLTQNRSSVDGTSNATNDRGVFIGGRHQDPGWITLNIIDYITISTTGDATDFGDTSSIEYGCAATSNGANNRGVYAGYFDGSASYKIEYITISTPGNGTNFGNLSVNRTHMGACSNGVNNRGVFGGGVLVGVYQNIIDYVTISSTGDATDFGDLTVTRGYVSSTSNGTNDRGIFAGGYTSYKNEIDYITISTTGNATDFGDLSEAKRSTAATSNA